MDCLDWLILLHIFEWADFWTAPTWFLVLLWIGFIVELGKKGKE